tara:strand:+ start:1398 stop:1595 length:198 start_codon:yes stop_codon:yes gene_type:complete
MDDRDFRFNVLKLTLETAAINGIKEPLELAQRNLEWCMKPIDKPKAQSIKRQTKSKQDKREPLEN